jgi:hypothetical protein
VKKVTSLVGFILLLGLNDPAQPALYDFTAEPEPGDTFSIADFRVFIPDDVAVIRGLFCKVSPLLADSRPYTADPNLQALAQNVDFGVMGARLDNLHMESGIGEAVLRALEDFSQQSLRPEIQHTTLYFEGYSWGGQFSYHFAKWLPERTLGFITQKGGYHDTAFAGEAILVPGYLFIGENDLPYRIENLTGIFTAHRPLGARWVLAVQPDAGHEPITDRVLLDRFFLTVISQRLPAVIPLTEPPELVIIPETGRWLGNRENFLIGSWDCYNAEVDSACWFISREVGSDWQWLVSAGAVTDTVSCPTTHVSHLGEKPSWGCRWLPNHPNPFNPRTTLHFEVVRSQRLAVNIWDVTGRRVIQLADEVFGVGRHTLTWEGRNRWGRAVASGPYLVEMRGQQGAEPLKIQLIR